MEEPEVIIEQIKNGRRFFVEADENTLYLYITSEDFKKMYGIMWIANLKEAPEDYDYDFMENGMPTRMPASHCKNKEGLLKIPFINFVWSSNSLVILCDNELVCRIEDAFG